MPDEEIKDNEPREGDEAEYNSVDKSEDKSAALPEQGERVAVNRHGAKHESQQEQSRPALAPPPAVKEEQQPAAHSPNTPGVLILQWLTYAFWGWTLVALYFLTGLSVSYFVAQSSQASSYALTGISTSLAYALAAVIVLFVISMVCDIIYSRLEPRRKTGAAMVIMVIHAVIFALCSIGSLIVAVFAFVNMLISGGDTQGATTTMITAIIMTVLYGLTLVRTLRPGVIKHVTRLYWAVMIVATLAITSLSIVGPVAYSQQTKNDRAIEQGLSNLAYAINDYAEDKGRLPSSLKDSELTASYRYDGDTERIVSEGLVRYVPKKQLTVDTATGQTADDNLSASRMTIGTTPADTSPVFHYQLCVTYDKKGGNTDYYDSSYKSRTQRYDTTPNVSRHPAGDVCYDLQTSYMY